MEKCAFCSKILSGSDEEICLDTSEVDGVFCNVDCAENFIRECISVVNEENEKRNDNHKP